MKRLKTYFDDLANRICMGIAGGNENEEMQRNKHDF